MLGAGDALRRRRVLLTAIVPLLVWQWWAPVRETVKGAVDPSAQAGLAFLRPVFSDRHWQIFYALSSGALMVDARLRPSAIVERGGHCDRPRRRPEPACEVP